MDSSGSVKMDIELQQLTHSYSCHGKKRRRKLFTLNMLSEAPPPKKLSKGDATDDLMLSQVQQSIIQIIRQSSEEIKDMLKENINSINLLKKALEAVHSEIFDIQKENEELKNKNEANLKRISELEDKMNEQDCYSRRWNLRLEGMPEHTDENVKSRIMEICKEVVIMEDRDFVASKVDIAH